MKTKQELMDYIGAVAKGVEDHVTSPELSDSIIRTALINVAIEVAIDIRDQIANLRKE